MFDVSFVRPQNNFDLGKIKIQYEVTKQTPDELESGYNPFVVTHINTVNPVYSCYFTDDDNCNTKQLNSHFHITDLETVHKYDKPYESIKKKIFIKYSPLIDPIHFLVGKNDKHKLKDEINQIIKCNRKTCDYNNQSYVDSFFNYLSSQLMNNHSFLNGIDFYGSFTCIQEKHKMNISEDYEYLSDSQSFHDNRNVLYDYQNTTNIRTLKTTSDTRVRKKKIAISDISSNILDYGIIDDDDDEITTYNNNTNSTDLGTVDVIFEYKKKDGSNTDDDTESNTSDNSFISDSTNDECNDNDSVVSNDSNCDNDTYSMDDSSDCDNPIYIHMYNFPTQMICIEECDGTIDYLLENNMLSVNQKSSALAQVIFSLIAFQKCFDFTHNDLHTNNIVYKNTELKHINYVYKGKIYKVPTYGKIFKIIDFGRSIYKFKSKLFCSDSFSKSGDAHTQYNFGPYYDNRKRILEPNFSFDLCRLGCSLYDFIFDEDEQTILVKDIKQLNCVQEAVLRWCTDDRGKNILYKASTGEERYPNFKLYKMISRTVHNNTPDNELNHKLLNQYLLKSKKIIKNNLVNIDIIPCYSSF